MGTSLQAESNEFIDKSESQRDMTDSITSSVRRAPFSMSNPPVDLSKAISAPSLNRRHSFTDESAPTRNGRLYPKTAVALIEILDETDDSELGCQRQYRPSASKYIKIQVLKGPKSDSDCDGTEHDTIRGDDILYSARGGPVLIELGKVQSCCKKREFCQA